MYEYRATVRRVVDADTIDVDIDLGLFVHVHERLRLFGIDAWEVRGPERERGLEAKAALEAFFSADPEIIVRTIRDKKGKYGRFLAEVYTLNPAGAPEIHINEWLVERGHAEWRDY